MLLGWGNMTERKVVGRNIVVITGVACIVLAVGLIVALVAYLPANNQINSLNTQLAQNNETITSLNAQITVLRDQVDSLTEQNSASNQASLQNEITSLNSEIESLLNVLYLNASGTLINSNTFSIDPNSNTTIWEDTSTPLLYSGFVTVQVESSSNTTFVELSYASYSVIYDSIIPVGLSGSASFPALPGPIVIALGNTEANSTVTGTVTAVYYY
jgi:cell division protein FtsB